MANHALVRRSPKWRRAGLLLSGVSVPLCWQLAAPADAALLEADGTHTVTVGDTAEAWYADSPVDLCTTPLGCPPADVPTSPYPADTLHVGVAGGQETARTYVLPDLAGIPYGATPTAGTMTLPLATGDQDGTQAPETAKLLACLATKPVTDGAEGSTAAPPSIDCKTSAKAVYDGKKGLFTLDIEPFLSAWADGALPYGVALLPNPKAVQPTDAWHVAFNARKHKGGDHIESVISFTPPPPVPTGTTVSGVGDTTTPPAADASVPGAGSGGPVSLPDAGTGDADAAQPAPEVAQPPAAAAPQPVAFVSRYQYPMAFLLPLALLAGTVFFTRLFTRDATPKAPSR